MRLLSLFLVLAGVSATSVAGRAREVDPTLGQRLSLDVVTAPRRSLEQGSLPRAASVAFRLRVASGIAHAPTVTADRTILLTHTDPVLAEYDARGRVIWSARLGPNPAAASPFVFGDGTRAVLTQGGEVLGFSRRGRPLLRMRLPFSNLDSTLLLEPTRDGGLVLAEGRRVVRLDATGSVVSDTRIDAEVRALLPSVGPNGVASRTWIVGEGGRVFELATDGRCLPRSRFGGPVTAVARLGASRLLAVIDERRLVELDVLGDAAWTRAESPDLELSRVFAVNSSGETRVLGGADLLVAYDANQQERFRVALSPPGAAAAAGADVSSEFLLDPSGTTLVARPGLGAIAIAPDGHVSRVEGSSCAEPLRPAWLGGKAVVLACRSGVLLRLDGAPKTSAPAQ